MLEIDDKVCKRGKNKKEKRLASMECQKESQAKSKEMMM